MADDDIILSELSDDELVLQMHDDLYDGLKEEIEEAVNLLIARGWTPYDVLTKALVAGMTIVGADFRDGILFVPEVLLAANAMKGGMAILKPLLAETGAPRMGKMVIGTVKGDIHDIGKNLVAMMLEGAGFEVFDLGINTDADSYISTARPSARHHRMSALLTTTRLQGRHRHLVSLGSARLSRLWACPLTRIRPRDRADASPRRLGAVETAKNGCLSSTTGRPRGDGGADGTGRATGAFRDIRES